jgi:tRNA nucleotidyltransferase (CCA-adding enzyme)
MVKTSISKRTAEKLKKLPPAVLQAMKRLQDGGYQAYLVGGSLRDLLLGKTHSDWDLATDAPPNAVMQIFPHHYPTGIAHGTVTAHYRGLAFEITTFRSEGTYTDGRHPDSVAFVSSIEEDLSRRDFTINALAYDPFVDRFLDLFRGTADLSKGIIRAVGDPDERFNEDGLRPLRAIRFAVQLNFDIEEQTYSAISRAKERFLQVSAERVRDEMQKIMFAEKPSLAFELLRDVGYLEHILPELLEGWSVPQNEFHAYDIYGHGLETCDAAPKDKQAVRWSALLHDIGKAKTRVEHPDGRVTFYMHQEVGAKSALAALRRLRFSAKEAGYIAHLIRHHMFNYTPDWSDSAVRRFVRKVGKENIADLFDLRLADWKGNGLTRGFPTYLDIFRDRIEAIIAAGDALTVRDLAIDGEQVMKLLNIPPGPQVGEILERLLAMVLDNPQCNTAAYLKEQVLKLGGKAGK